MLVAIALVAVLAAAFAWRSRDAQVGPPDPIHYGEAVCAYCRMVLGERGFAGVLKSSDGGFATYDDIGCMVRAADACALDPSAIAVWFEDHAGAGWVARRDATLVRTPRSEDHPATPMGYGVVAFASEGAARAYAKEKGGEIVAWQRLFDELHEKYAPGARP